MRKSTSGAMRMALTTLFTGLFFLVFSSPSPAAETEKTHAGQYIRAKDGSSAPFDMNEYNVPGSRIDLRYTMGPGAPAAGDGMIRLTCTGAHTQGGWTFTIDSGSQCWNSYTLPCYYEGGVQKCDTRVSAREIRPEDVRITPYSLCGGAFRGTPAAKDYCVFDDDGAGFVTGDTGDDMFAVRPGAHAFLEYARKGPIGTPRRLTFITRTPDGAGGVMLPSGPVTGDPGTDFTDFDNFMDNPPRGNGMTVTARDACYPAKITVCADAEMENALPFDGQCGTASGLLAGRYNAYFANAAAIPVTQRCAYGTASEVADTGNRFEWTCSGGNGGRTSEMCVAGKEPVQMCGTSHNRSFANLASIPKDGTSLCARGTASAISGSGPWIWTCSSGPETQACAAFGEGRSCAPGLKNVVYLVDDSGSMVENRAFGIPGGETRLALAKRVVTTTFEAHIKKERTEDPDADRIGITRLNDPTVPGNQIFTNWKCDSAKVTGGTYSCTKGGTWLSMANPGVADSMLSKGRTKIKNIPNTDKGTPLYSTVNKLANLLKGGDANEPNAIILFSDGGDDVWKSVLDADEKGVARPAKGLESALKKQNETIAKLLSYPHLQVHIVDVSNSEEPLRPLADATGGIYARATNEAELQAFLNLMALGCGP